MNDFLQRWTSTKLWTALVAMGLILTGFVMCKDRNAVFGEYVCGVLTAAGLLKAANLVEKLKGPKPPLPPPPAP